MTPRRTVSRRSFIGRVTGGLALFGSSSLVMGNARAMSGPGQSGITDRDPIDAVGNGRGGVMAPGTGTPPQSAPRNPYEPSNERRAGTGVTDRDPSDPVNYGRGTTPQGAPRNPYAEPNSREAGTGVTDRDPSDPVNHGRGSASPGTAPRRCSDADTGPGHDPGGQGRRC